MKTDHKAALSYAQSNLLPNSEAERNLRAAYLELRGLAKATMGTLGTIDFNKALETLRAALGEE